MLKRSEGGGGGRLNDFNFGTFISCFPSDGVASMAVKGLVSTETIRLIRDGEKGEEGMEVGEREIIYLSLHCHHQNLFCINVGSDDSHFNVS